MTTAPDIFLSYSREDHARAEMFASAFKAAGLDVWWDMGLRAGEAYDEVTEAALRNAKAVVVLWSKRSVMSRWVRAEATLADRNKTLVPAMIEPCERPIMFELTQTAELMHWQGDASDKAWRTFLADVKRFVARELAPEAPTIPVAAPTVEETLKPGQSGTAPSLAVLPFINRSSNPDDEVFAEGMAEDVIAALSQGTNVRVLGSMVTANLNRATIADPAALARQLGVSYLLEGNVRRVGASLRVTTQLLEAATGEVVWTAKFDRPLAELAALQEDLVTELAGSLDTQVYNLEMARALSKPRDITAWEAVARAISAYRRFDANSVLFVRKEAERAVAIAPDYGPGHAILAHIRANQTILGSDLDEDLRQVRAIAHRALDLAPEDPMVLAHAGYSLSLVGDTAEGLRHAARAVRKAPGSGMTHHYHGVCLLKMRRFEEAVVAFETAYRLMPGSLLLVYTRLWQAGALFALDRTAEAEACVDDAIAINPSTGMARVSKALFCLRRGDVPEARSHLDAARHAGWSEALAVRVHRAGKDWSGTIEDELAALRALYAATEPVSGDAGEVPAGPEGARS